MNPNRVHGRAALWPRRRSRPRTGGVRSGPRCIVQAFFRSTSGLHQIEPLSVFVLPRFRTGLSLMSFVKHLWHDWDVLHARQREVDLGADRAEERTGPEDVGDQTLMRGLDTALPFVRPGLSLSAVGRQSYDRPRRDPGSSPCRGPVLTSARLIFDGGPLLIACCYV